MKNGLYAIVRICFGNPFNVSFRFDELLGVIFSPLCRACEFLGLVCFSFGS